MDGMMPVVRALGPLATKTMETLGEFFERRDHNPSAEHRAALADIARTMEDMARGTAEPVVFLSAVDPGVGKTQTVTHFLRALVADESMKSVGAVVCVGSYNQVADLITAFVGVDASVGVLTADQRTNDLGRCDPECAQVLITTQQGVALVGADRPFGDVKKFHYRGQPRAVRVWDEAWMPGEAVTVSRGELLSLFEPLERICPEAAEDLEVFTRELKDAKDDALIAVPDLLMKHGITCHDILAKLGGPTEQVRDGRRRAAENLEWFSGKAARVYRRDGKGVVLDFRDRLPDLAPMIVLDAGIRVRHAYRHVDKGCGGVAWLEKASKDYSPLTINVWRAGGGKDSFRRNGDRLKKGSLRLSRASRMSGGLSLPIKEGAAFQT